MAASRRNLSIKAIKRLSKMIRKALQIKRSLVVVTLILHGSKDYLQVGPPKILMTTLKMATTQAAEVIPGLSPRKALIHPRLKAKKKGNNW